MLQQIPQKLKEVPEITEKIYIRKLKNLEEMDKWINSGLSLNKMETEHLNKLIAGKGNNSAIKSLTKNKSLGLDEFASGFFFQIF